MGRSDRRAPHGQVRKRRDDAVRPHLRGSGERPRRPLSPRARQRRNAPSSRWTRQRIAFASACPERRGKRGRFHVARQSTAGTPELTQKTQRPGNQRGRTIPRLPTGDGSRRSRDRVGPRGPPEVKWQPRLTAAASKLTGDVPTSTADWHELRHESRRLLAETEGREARLVRRGTARVPQPSATRDAGCRLEARAKPATGRHRYVAGPGLRRGRTARGAWGRALHPQRETRQAGLSKRIEDRRGLPRALSRSCARWPGEPNTACRLLARHRDVGAYLNADVRTRRRQRVPTNARRRTRGPELKQQPTERRTGKPGAPHPRVQKAGATFKLASANKSVELCTHGGTGRARRLHCQVTELTKADSLGISELPLSFLTCATLRPSCR